MRIKERFESCVLKVKATQPKSCKSKKWKGKGCVNPWAICNSSVYGLRRSSRKYSINKPRRSISRRKPKSLYRTVSRRASMLKASASKPKRSASRRAPRRKASKSKPKTLSRRAPRRKAYKSKSKRIASRRAPRRKASKSKAKRRS